MSVSTREAANSSEPAANHRGSGSNMMFVMGEMTEYVWQQAEMQLPSCVDDPVPKSPDSGTSAHPDPEGCPQQSWEAHAPTPASRNTATSKRGKNPMMSDRRDIIII